MCKGLETQRVLRRAGCCVAGGALVCRPSGFVCVGEVELLCCGCSLSAMICLSVEGGQVRR